MKSKYLFACPFLADQSETHKTVEQGDDLEPQVVIKKHQCAVKNIYTFEKESYADLAQFEYR